MSLMSIYSSIYIIVDTGTKRLKRTSSILKSQGLIIHWATVEGTANGTLLTRG